MINSKKELKFFLMADRMMNTGSFKPSIKRRIYEMLGGGSIIRYLIHLRKTEYYEGRNKLLYFYHLCRYRSLGRNLGFSIGLNRDIQLMPSEEGRIIGRGCEERA